MRLRTDYRILIRNPKGKLVKDSGLIPSRSYVIQFLEMVRAFFANSGSAIATDVDGTEQEICIANAGAGQNYVRADAGVGDDAYGIVVGTNAGASPEDNEDYELDTKIVEGVASGELSYEAMTFVAPASNGNVDFDITRTFLNEHATDPVSVEEIGLICKNVISSKYHLLLRDVVAEEVVAAGFTLTVVYTLRTTV